MKIEKYLVLNKYFLWLFGEKDNRGLLRYLKSVEEGERDNLTNFAISLMTKGGVRLPKDEIKRYDQNIREYVGEINKKRQEKIRLKYFQYLAVLFTEIFLDRLKNRKWEFLAELNRFVNSLEKKGKRNRRRILRRRPQKACLLDGNGVWQNPHNAHKLFAVFKV
jgi:hypothetical protein